MAEEKIPEPREINGRSFEFSEKSISDHIQIFNEFTDRDAVIEALSNPHYIDGLSQGQAFAKGRTITIEAEVTDSLFSSLIFKAMYGKSHADGKQLEVMGLRINTIHFKGAAVFSELEQQVLQNAAAILKAKLDPNDEIKASHGQG
jgi:hypothetical protein